MTTNDPRNPGYRYLTPNLTVVDAKKSVEFYKKAFGFETGYMHEEAGVLVHVTMQYRDQNIIMFSPEGQFNEKLKAPVSTKLDLPLSLYVYVDNVDETVEKVKAAGGAVILEPSDAPWGDRFATVKDVDGYSWGLGCYLSASA